jgi:hypothetical protein
MAAGIAVCINSCLVAVLEHLQVTEDTFVLYFSLGRYVKEIFAA